MGYQVMNKIEMEPSGLSETYFHTMMHLMGENRDIMELEADLGVCILGGGYKEMEQTYPKQLFNCGIQEANMVGVACGLSAVGKIPFCHTFAPFLARRANDQIFISACYAGANIRLVGSDPGVMAAFNGGTHMPFEDVAALRAFPELTIVEPTDSVMLVNLMDQLAKLQGVYYIRMARKPMAKVYQEGSDFTIGKGCVIRPGSDVTIVAAGIMVAEAMEAAELLAADGISARVVDMFTIKPIDEDLLTTCAQETGAIVTAENHNIIGGLGSAVCETLGSNCPVPVERVGVKDRFGEVGPIDYLKQVMGLTAQDIAVAAKKSISRK